MSRLALVLLLALPAASADRPLYFERPITSADLDGRSLRELTLMRNWIFAKRGNAFRRPWLDAFFRAQRWYSVKEPVSTAGLSAGEVVLDDKNAVAIGDYEAALTTEQLVALRDAVRARVKAAGGRASADDAIELRLLSVRLGGWAGEGDAPKDLTPLENPERLAKLLKLTDLDGLSGRDLKLLRNAVFARHGRPFTTDLVKGHFKTVTWYAPDEKYADARLTDIDKKNVKLILSLEDKLKRPAPKDERPDGWYVAA
ncbi:MAG: YARHG domain-containing protein [Deltaproteobacteria bacterium]|nr:YARHG domain-containing protein [Deltaproteobacteria bacterium]